MWRTKPWKTPFTRLCRALKKRQLEKARRLLDYNYFNDEDYDLFLRKAKLKNGEAGVRLILEYWNPTEKWEKKLWKWAVKKRKPELILYLMDQIPHDDVDCRITEVAACILDKQFVNKLVLRIKPDHFLKIAMLKTDHMRRTNYSMNDFDADTMVEHGSINLLKYYNETHNYINLSLAITHLQYNMVDYFVSMGATNYKKKRMLALALV